MDNKIKRNKIDDHNNVLQCNVDFKYICIKKEFCDVSMIYLNYYNLKKRKQIEIVYKSPSIFLDGLFLKTPEINLYNINIMKHDRNKFTNKSDNIDIKLVFDNNNESQMYFVNLLLSLDEYILNYLNTFSNEIEEELKVHHNDNRSVNAFKYVNIIKKHQQGANTKYELIMKSYLDKKIINNLNRKIDNINHNKYLNNIIDITTTDNATDNIIDITTDNTTDNSTDNTTFKTITNNDNEDINNSNVNLCDNQNYDINIDSNINNNIDSNIDNNTGGVVIDNDKYIFTFNISNIYFGNVNLIPLVKTNRLEII